MGQKDLLSEHTQGLAYQAFREHPEVLRRWAETHELDSITAQRVQRQVGALEPSAIPLPQEHLERTVAALLPPLDPSEVFQGLDTGTVSERLDDACLGRG